jgi:DMSO reductase family type II enzyme molybdopterin subunit
MASVFKSKYILIWAANPAATRIPDAHFFWEAKYHGAQIIAICPDFTATAMHASRWLNPKPGTDLALAMAMIHAIIEEKTYNRDYIIEQTDLPFLVRTDNNKFLRESDFSKTGQADVFYVWDEQTGKPVRAPATGQGKEPGATLLLGDIRPSLEGRWMVETLNGTVEVTTVFEIVKRKVAEQSPEWAARITGLNAQVIRQIAREFATTKPAMIYTGYQACKWLHGDLTQRAMILMLSLTGNIGYEGSGLQILNSVKTDALFAFAFSQIGPSFRMLSGTTWDYEKGNMKQLNEKVYGLELAEMIESHYRKSVQENWFPSYAKNGWKMGLFAGNGSPGWVASAKQWREEAFDKLDTIVVLAPDMGFAAHHADYVLPIAHHYERVDMMFHSRLPYIQVLDAAVPPLGESADDWTAMYRLLAAISERATMRGVKPIDDVVDGRTFTRDFTKYLDLYTMNGKVNSIRDVIQFVLDKTLGLPKLSVAELAAKGIVRVNGSDSTIWESPDAPYHTEMPDSVVHKRPYQTMTGRQQFYFDHEWFIKFDETVPTYHESLRLDQYPLRFIMGHARHGVHTMWRDHPLLLQLQRGEPDVYVNEDDAARRGVKDRDLIRVFSPSGEFIAQAHVSSGIQPGMVYMYHGWDPMMFRTRHNFSSVICSAGLIKPTSLVGDYGHLGHRLLQFAPNQTYRDFTVNFEKYEQKNQRS